MTRARWPTSSGSSTVSTFDIGSLYQHLAQNLDLDPTERTLVAALPRLDRYVGFLLGFRSTFDRTER